MTITNIGARIRALRKSRDLSVPQLAQKLGYSQETVYQWEWGKRSPRFDQVEAIAAELGVAIAELVTLELPPDSITPPAA